MTIEHDGRVDGSKIDVEASHGHVTLIGSVPHMYEKRIIEQDVRNTVGVAWVTDELLVSGVRRGDDAILSDILANLESDYLLNGIDLTIRVHRGVVKLAGDVSNDWEREHAEELVVRIPGVTKIVNDVKVEANHYSNAAAKKKLAERLSQNWITAPVHQAIDVEIENGVVTLTGEVSNWAQRAEAAQISLNTPGIWAVHDNLAVRDVSYPWELWDDEVVVRIPDRPIWP
jgi:osmotically-inducible protein OsmY